MSRASDLDRLYELFDRLEAKVGGKRRLEDCTGHMDWPERGVYFVFANGETRDGTDQLRLTRVGTHAVSTGSETSLWSRLRTHRGASRLAESLAARRSGCENRTRVSASTRLKDSPLP